MFSSRPALAGVPPNDAHQPDKAAADAAAAVSAVAATNMEEARIYAAHAADLPSRVGGHAEQPGMAAQAGQRGVPMPILDPANAAANRKAREEAQRAAREAKEAMAEDDAVGEADEADTFATYKPSKMPLGKGHPDRVVETSALGAQQPPDVAGLVRLALPRDTIERGLLSQIQLETLVYAKWRFSKTLPSGERAGIFLGDGAGMGKGRTIAGVVYEAYSSGVTKALWFSASDDLKKDAKRDFDDIGAGNIPLHLLKDTKSGEKVSFAKKFGVMFSTYSLLVGAKPKGKDKGTLSRLDQLVEWCQRDVGTGADVVIVFDECHKAKNASDKADKGSKTANCVVKLQQLLPNARVMYVSATGASALKNLGYMSRLGLWGDGTDFENATAFAKDVEKKGGGAMEMVSMDMKCRGMMITRQLSFEGTLYTMQEVELTPECRHQYDTSARIYGDIWAALSAVPDGPCGGRCKCPHCSALRSAVTSFWGGQLSYFRELCMSAKVDEVVGRTEEAIGTGVKCVVIGLQTTGESALAKALEDGLEVEDGVEAPVSVAEAIILRAVQLLRKPNLRGDSGPRVALADRLEEEVRGLQLPPNVLDDIIDRLGGADRVAEMTGRSKRLLRDPDDDRFYLMKRLTAEGKADHVNIEERNAFQSGRKLIGIISDAASTGVSLHASRTVENQKKRVHITLQLPWAADRAVQQLGRTHRSNQSTAPEYVLMLTAIGGEKRFGAAVAGRMKTLGALSKGDRRAAGAGDKGGIEDLDIDKGVGIKALELLLNDVQKAKRRALPAVVSGFLDHEDPSRPIDCDKAQSYGEAALEAMVRAGLLLASGGGYVWSKKQDLKAEWFLNRLFNVNLELQAQIFEHFEGALSKIRIDERLAGSFSDGIVDVAGDNFEIVGRQIIYRDPDSQATAELVIYTSDRGVSWEDAIKRYEEARETGGHKNAFFLMTINAPFGYSRNSDERRVALAIGRAGTAQFKIIRPAIGMQGGTLTKAVIREKYSFIRDMDKGMLGWAKKQWTHEYDHAAHSCAHSPNACQDPDCVYGTRKRERYVVAGACLKLWKRLNVVIGGSRMSIVRFSTSGLNAAGEACSVERVVGIDIKNPGHAERLLSGADPAKNKADQEEHRKASSEKLAQAEKDPYGTFWQDPSKLDPKPHRTATFADPSKKRRSGSDETPAAATAAASAASSAWPRPSRTSGKRTRITDFYASSGTDGDGEDGDDDDFASARAAFAPPPSSAKKKSEASPASAWASRTPRDVSTNAREATRSKASPFAVTVMDDDDDDSSGESEYLVVPAGNDSDSSDGDEAVAPTAAAKDALAMAVETPSAPAARSSARHVISSDDDDDGDDDDDDSECEPADNGAEAMEIESAVGTAISPAARVGESDEAEDSWVDMDNDAADDDDDEGGADGQGELGSGDDRDADARAHARVPPGAAAVAVDHNDDDAAAAAAAVAAPAAATRSTPASRDSSRALSRPSRSAAREKPLPPPSPSTPPRGSTTCSLVFVNGPMCDGGPEVLKVPIATPRAVIGRLHMRLVVLETGGGAAQGKSKVVKPPRAGGKRASMMGRATEGRFEVGVTTVFGRGVDKSGVEPDVVLPDSRVSRMHATLTFRGAEPPTVTNHSDKNGTWVGDKRVKKGASVTVSDGDVIAIAGESADTALYKFEVRFRTPAVLSHASDVHVVDGPKVVTFGSREPDADGPTVVLIRDPSMQMSRTHAKLRLHEQSGTWSIADAGSTNGLFLGSSSSNLVKIAPGEDASQAAQLNDGAQFALGGFHSSTKVGVRLPKLWPHVFSCRFAVHERAAADRPQRKPSSRRRE